MRQTATSGSAVSEGLAGTTQSEAQISFKPAAISAEYPPVVKRLF
jgi:hypothetical protein